MSFLPNLKLLLIPLFSICLMCPVVKAASLADDPLIELFENLHSLAITPNPADRRERIDAIKPLLVPLAEHHSFAGLAVAPNGTLSGESLEHIRELAYAFMTEREIQTVAEIYPLMLERWISQDRKFSFAVKEFGRTESQRRNRLYQTYALLGAAITWVAYSDLFSVASIPGLVAVPIILRRHRPVDPDAKLESEAAMNLGVFLKAEDKHCAEILKAKESAAENPPAADDSTESPSAEEPKE